MLEKWAWRGGRAVEGTGLENRRGREITVGSNPTPSARNSFVYGGSERVASAA
jgi:hypothetical protein